jgi:NAD-dependent DNA ligase
MSSYLYYKKDKSVLSDTDYDVMCKRIISEWNTIKHPHKKFVKKEALVAGTGYHIKKYPTITMSAGELWYSNWEKENG